MMKKSNLKLSVIIPAYNEEKRIIKTLIQVAKYLKSNFDNYDVTVYNDGSIDKTAEIIKKYINKHRLKNFKVVTLLKNIGKGATIKIGVLEAKKDWILVMDADSATPIFDIQRLIAKKGGAEVVYGSRYLDRSLLKVRQPIIRRMIGRIGNLLARLVLKINLIDTQCGFKLFSRHAARIIFPKMEVARWGWDLEVLVVAKEKKIEIAEIPVTWRHIADSKFRAGRGIWQTFKELLFIKNNLQKGKYK